MDKTQNQIFKGLKKIEKSLKILQRDVIKLESLWPDEYEFDDFHAGDVEKAREYLDSFEDIILNHELINSKYN